MRNKILALTAGVVLGAMLGGCGMANQGDLGNKNIRQNTIRYDESGSLIKDKRFADDGMNERNRVNGRQLRGNNLVGSHKNYRLEMNGTIADKITEIDGIQSAYVLLADDNAYVAVTLGNEVAADENQVETQSLGRTHIGLFDKHGARTGRRMSSLSTGAEGMTEEMKAEIAGIAKTMRPSIVHVYISTNPDFVGRMNAYMNDAKQGYPVQNYIMEFNALAERVFPVVKPKEAKSDMFQTNGVYRKYRLFD